jgi:hypothetical protein
VAGGRGERNMTRLTAAAAAAAVTGVRRRFNVDSSVRSRRGLPGVQSAGAGVGSRRMAQALRRTALRFARRYPDPPLPILCGPPHLHATACDPVRSAS